ncbi:hypothetical protein EV361DRAFT_1035507 [Lentinula raphanica]|nr:hypothetical protein EV361DRAFT_1035507 [Lentinula raphanica]
MLLLSRTIPTQPRLPTKVTPLTLLAKTNNLHTKKAFACEFDFELGKCPWRRWNSSDAQIECAQKVALTNIPDDLYYLRAQKLEDAQIATPVILDERTQQKNSNTYFQRKQSTSGQQTQKVAPLNIRKNVLSSQPLKAAFKPPRAFQGFGAPKACKDTPQILGTLSHLKVLGYSLRCFEVL